MDKIKCIGCKFGNTRTKILCFAIDGLLLSSVLFTQYTIIKKIME